MGKNLIMRLAAGAAGGTLALAAMAPALAHSEPAAGFNAVLHDPHHNVLVDSDQFPQLCDDVGEQFPDLSMDGFEVWVFNAQSGEFDESGDPIASIQFDSGVVDIPGYDHFAIGPESNPHNLGVAVPAGSTLLDGDFNVVDGGESPTVVVTHTCPGMPGDGNGGKPSPSPTPSSPGEDGDNGDNGQGGEDGDDDQLPVTGLQAGGLVVLGAGLLAAGGAMLFVRRRRSLAGLVDGSDG